LGESNSEEPMRRSQPNASKGVLEVDWPFFGELCRALALRVAREYEPEIVLGIAKAGVIPGVVVASILQTEFSSMAVTRQEVGAQPVLVSGPPPSIRGRRVLVVDETCDTGSTMRLALSEVRALQPAEVRSAVSFKTGEYAPDFHAFETDNFIILPWDREIIQGGELVMRPDYAARL
jgi:hypoxanthine phosphoribosyltransferase